MGAASGNQRGAMHRAPLRDIVVEGSTVWGDVGTSANHTVWSNTMPAVRGGTMPGDRMGDGTGLWGVVGEQAMVAGRSVC